MSYAEFIAAKRVVASPAGFEAPANLNPHLFAFQHDVCEFLLRLGRCAAFLDTGLGKTLVQLEWARCVVEHTNKPVLILAPLAVAAQTVREAQKFGIDAVVARDGSTVSGARIYVTNYERLDKFDVSAFDGVVLDECFAAGTKVDAPSGPVRIENIREGMYISNAVGTDRVSNVHRREVPYAVRVTTATACFIASPNHPVFTQRGWVGAQHLRPGDYALETTAAMSLVRDRICSEIPGSESAAVLRDILLSEMADEATGDIGGSSLARGGAASRTSESPMVPIWRSGSDEGIGKDCGVESIASPGSSGEDQPYIESHEAQTFRAWGQWQGSDSAAVDSDGCVGRRMDSGVSLVTGPTASRLSDALQTRLRESEIENRNRGGWRITPQSQSEGHQEGCGTGWVRVDGTEILESGNPELEQFRDADGKLYFYDLGATRHPSYSVNGMLVHNSGILKSFMGQTKRKLCELFADKPYRLACTATPAPNDYMELGNHSDFLGVMPSNEMLSRWFINDTMNFGTYRLKNHAIGPFWDWMASWSRCISKPSDLGYSDDGFVLPELHVHRHVLDSDMTEGADGALFRQVEMSATSLHKEKRLSLNDRAQKVAEEVNGDSEAWVVWCDTDYEADVLTRLIPDAIEVRGSQSLDRKEAGLLEFSEGRARVIITKPSIAGFGLNWQHCANMAFVGVSYSYESFYQAVRRCWRFGQKRPVNVHVAMAHTESGIWDTVTRKADNHDSMKREMRAAMLRNAGRSSNVKASYEAHHIGRLPEWLIAA